MEYCSMVGGLRIIFDLPAFIINLLITYLVYRGIKESRNFSNVMVILKLAIVVLGDYCGRKSYFFKRAYV